MTDEVKKAIERAKECDNLRDIVLRGVMQVLQQAMVRCRNVDSRDSFAIVAGSIAGAADSISRSVPEDVRQVMDEARATAAKLVRINVELPERKLPSLLSLSGRES